MTRQTPELARVEGRVLALVQGRKFLPDLTPLLRDVYLQAVCDVAEVLRREGWRPPAEVLE